jgi:hypothetical protein
MTVAASRPASADSGAGDFVGRINALRTGRGLRPLAVDGNLGALAQAHSEVMAGRADLHHTGDLRAGVSGSWTKLGENVGMGPDNGTVWQAFVNSPGHFANLVDPSFTHVGVAVVWRGGTEWTTHRFRAGPDAPPPPPPPPPAPAPAPAPRVAAEPAAAPVPAPRPAPAPAPATGAAPAPAAVPASVSEAPPAPDTAEPVTAASAEAGEPAVAPVRGGLDRWLAEATARAVVRAEASRD